MRKQKILCHPIYRRSRKEKNEITRRRRSAGGKEEVMVIKSKYMGKYPAKKKSMQNMKNLSKKIRVKIKNTDNPKDCQY